MANKDTEEGSTILITILVIAGIIAFFVAQWLFILLIVIISVIIVGGINSSKKKKLEKEFNKISESAFSNSTLKPVANANRKELKEKLGLFDIDVYDNLFEPQIRTRGFSYFADNKLEKISGANKWTCVAKGTKDYNVMVAFDNDQITYTSCSCPYYLEDKKNCKHIYALLLEAKSKPNIPIIKEAMLNFSSNLKRMFKEEIKYINDYEKYLKIDEYKFNTLKNIINTFIENNTKTIESIKEKNYGEKELFDGLIALIQEGYKLNESIKETVYDLSKVSNPAPASEAVEYMNDSNRIKLGDVVAGALIADEIDKTINKKKKIDTKLEKEMDAYGLEDWQKDLVRKGEYEPWNFDEEDLEEGDYYYEDDE